MSNVANANKPIKFPPMIYSVRCNKIFDKIIQ